MIALIEVLIRKGFAELGVQRVFAETMAVNAASRRVMEKAGLKLVRSFHQPWPDQIDGAEHGDVEYALGKAEWERQRTLKPPPPRTDDRGTAPDMRRTCAGGRFASSRPDATMSIAPPARPDPGAESRGPDVGSTHRG